MPLTPEYFKVWMPFSSIKQQWKEDLPPHSPCTFQSVAIIHSDSWMRINPMTNYLIVTILRTLYRFKLHDGVPWRITQIFMLLNVRKISFKIFAWQYRIQLIWLPIILELLLISLIILSIPVPYFVLAYDWIKCGKIQSWSSRGYVQNKLRNTP